MREQFSEFGEYLVPTMVALPRLIRKVYYYRTNFPATAASPDYMQFKTS